MQGLCDVAGRYTQHICLVAVDCDTSLWLRELEVHVGHLQHIALIHLLHKQRQHLLQTLDGHRLQHILHRHTASSVTEGCLLLHEGTSLGVLLHHRRKFLSNLHLRTLTSRDVLQRHLDITTTAAHTGCHIFRLWHQRVNLSVDVLGVVTHKLISDTLLTHRIDRNHRAVLQRSKLGRDSAPQPADDDEHCDSDRNSYPAVLEE